MGSAFRFIDKARSTLLVADPGPAYQKFSDFYPFFTKSAKTGQKRGLSWSGRRIHGVPEGRGSPHMQVKENRAASRFSTFLS